MKIIYDPSEDYNDVPHTYYELEKYNDDSQDEIFFYGYHCSVDGAMKEKYSHYKRKIYYNWESPCSFWCSNNAVSSQLYFENIH